MSIVQVVEQHDTYWTSIEDGDSLSYVPELHDHRPSPESSAVAEKVSDERSHHQLIAALVAGRDNAGDRYRCPEAVCWEGLAYAYCGLRLSQAAEAVLRRGDLDAIVAGLLALDPMAGHAIGWAGSILNGIARGAAERLDAWQDLDVLVPAIMAEVQS